MTFGEALAVFIRHYGTVIPEGNSEPERAVKQNLARCGLQQVSSPNDFGNAHSSIIDYACKLVRRYAVAPPNEEVAEIVSRDKLLRTKVLVVKLDCLGVGNAEAPIHALPRGILYCRHLLLRSASTRIVRFLVLVFMWSAGGQREIFARAFAGIEEPSVEQFSPSGQIVFTPFALRVGLVVAAQVRTFLPADAEPTKIFEHRVIKLRTRPVLVEIVVAQDQDSLCFVCARCRGEKRGGVAQVQSSRG